MIHRQYPRPRLAARGATATAAVALLGLAAPAGAATPADPGHPAKTAAVQHLVARAATGAPGPGTRAIGAVRQAFAPRRAPADSTPPAAPPTAPVLTVTGTDGVLSISAASSAAAVLFEFDGVALGAPATVSDGQAAAELASWGYPNGAHAVLAADCASADPASCNTAAPATGTVALANAAPVVTAPAGGARITGGFTVSAEAPGGGVRFLIDGRRRGFAATAPYRFAYTGSALAPGRHTVTAVECSSDEARCDGPGSGTVVIVSESLHPTVRSISPARFSPNRDRVKDTTTVSFALPDAETVDVVVSNARGAIVRGRRLGTLGRGSHTWVWNGAANSGATVPSGVYRIGLSTTAVVNGALVKGLVWGYVTVDDRAPSLTAVHADATVYPVRDGYRDALAVGFRVDERARLTLTVRDARNRVVRSVTAIRDAGPRSLTWNVRDRRNRVVPAGGYRWVLTATDAVGNHRSTVTHRVGVSTKRLVRRTATLTRNGDGFYLAGASDPSCAEASTALSDYRHGVWLANSCLADPQLQIAAAFYHVAVPAAVRYAQVSVQVHGFALFAPTRMETGFGVAGGSAHFGIGGLHTIATSRPGWYRVGVIAAGRYVGAAHRMNISISVDNALAPCDFDIDQVRVTIGYQVLR